MVWRIGLGLCVIFSLSGEATADSVRLQNGSEIVGEIILETKDEVMIKTSHGVLTYAKKDVAQIKKFRVPPRREVDGPRRGRPEPAEKDRPEKQRAAERTPVEPTGPDAKSAAVDERLGSHSVYSLDTCTIKLPTGFQAVAKSELPPEAQGKATHLGEFLEATTQTRVSVIRIDLPEGVPSETLETLMWQNLEAIAKNDPRIDLERGQVGSHRAILGKMTSNEGGEARQVLSAYVFGHPRGFHVLSISALSGVASQEAARLGAIRKSFRLVTATPR